jgi:hypothetical protein
MLNQFDFKQTKMFQKTFVTFVVNKKRKNRSKD